MRDDALAQGDEIRAAHVVLGIIGAPRADDEAPCAVRLEHMIDGWQKREAELLSGIAQLGLGVVVGADQLPVQFFAGAEVMRAVVADGLVDSQTVAFAGEVAVGKPIAVAL